MKWISFIVSALCLTVGIQVARSQGTCDLAETCDECYSNPMGCSWCSDPNAIAAVRCFMSNETFVACPDNFIENTRSSQVLNQLELNSDNQISISRATVKLRAGETQTFDFKVRPAENFPLDLYMLVDLSFSLRNDLDTFRNISSDIAAAIRNISTRFQVGFGSYVDKVQYPYTSLYSAESPFKVVVNGTIVMSSCSDIGENFRCITPFSYSHNINLTNSSSQFVEGFDMLEISTNADNPEDPFDAIAQSLLCPEIVGWRDNSRKIILIITDNTVHMAGDGYLAGIVKPAPLECKTRYDPAMNVYTYIDNTEFDYYSLGQVRDLLRENVVSPVFAVRGSIRPFYDVLNEELADVGSQVTTIAAASANIIPVIQTAYENIVSKVQLTFSTPDNIRITHSVQCPNSTYKSNEDESCNNVTTNDTITFTVSVTMEQCLSSEQLVTLSIPGYGQLEVLIEPICACDCDVNTMNNQCAANGTFTCGICECDEGWTGDMCQCRTDEVDTLMCPNGPNGLLCSSRGLCFCGVCECRLPNEVNERVVGNQTFFDIRDSDFEGLATTIEAPVISGDSCECSNYLCDRRDGDNLVCSGRQGNCTCSGLCECSTHEYGGLRYTGSACQCNRAFCYNQSEPYSPDRLECNGEGECDPCNPSDPCVCRTGFVAPYCLPLAQSLGSCFGSGPDRNCIECIANSDNDINRDCPQCLQIDNNRFFRYNGTNIGPEGVVGSQNDSTSTCSYTTADPICTYTYYIALDPQSTVTDLRQIVIVEEVECFPLRPWHLALILLGSLIILGIIILVIIKIIFVILDYREVKHLAKSVAATDLSKNFNPLYTSPEVKYDNIAFGKE